MKLNEVFIKGMLKHHFECHFHHDANISDASLNTAQLFALKHYNCIIVFIHKHLAQEAQTDYVTSSCYLPLQHLTCPSAAGRSGSAFVCSRSPGPQ